MENTTRDLELLKVMAYLLLAVIGLEAIMALPWLSNKRCKIAQAQQKKEDQVSKVAVTY